MLGLIGFSLAWYIKSLILKLCKVHTTREQGETFILRGQMAQANSTFHLTAELIKQIIR
jgi:hypothetical protein